MDQIKPGANRRFDLLDVTRWLGHLTDAFGDILGHAIGGNPEYYTGGAQDVRLRPMILRNFEITGSGTPTFTVNREEVSGGQTYEAIIYDKDGNRLCGPNSPVTQTFSPAALPATPTTRYLIARRLASDTNQENRIHYSASLGKYSSSVYTQTQDHWEISDAQKEIGANTSASTTTALRDAGWVDIATFEMNAGNIQAVVPATPDCLGAFPLSWLVAPPAPDRYPLNIYELILSITQILNVMRWGTGGPFVGNERGWMSDPSYDACFEEEGGIRFGGGTTAAVGLRDAYHRLLQSAVGWDQHTFSNDAFANSDDLQFIRAKGIIAGDLSASGDPDPANNVGFCYSTSNLGPNNLVEVEKWISVDASGMLPGVSGTGQTPWTDPVTASNNWYLGYAPSNLGTETNAGPTQHNLGWRYELDVGASQEEEQGLFIPLTLPHLSRLREVEVKVSFDLGGMDANHYLKTYIIRRRHDILAPNPTCTTKLVEIINNGAVPQAQDTTASGGCFITGDTVDATKDIVDNEQYAYYILVTNFAAAAVAASDQIRVTSGHARVGIREASLVY